MIALRNKLAICAAAVCALAPFSVSADFSVSNLRNLGGDRSTYHNPIIHADYSDPDIVAAPDGKTFYMTASSFQCTPGLPILKSTDLVNWKLVNHALDSVPPGDFYAAAPRHGKGVWAPCIRYHDGKYMIYWGDPDFGVFMVSAADPEGEWSTPVLVRPGKGLIDPTPLWDTDGRAYLLNAWAGSRSGFNSVLTLSEMSADGTKVTSLPKIVYDGNDGVNHTVEGPKLYKHGDYYYVFAPAGGVVDGWQIVLRSKNIAGPYDVKTVMARGDAPFNGPHQGGWVETAGGETWFVNFQDKGAYGRVIHLNPMKWVDGWPVIGDDSDGDGCGKPVVEWRRPKLKASEESTLTPEADLFQWHSNYNDFFGFPLEGALMRLYGHQLSAGYVNFWEVPNLWLQKFPAEEFEMTSKVRVSAKGAAEGVESGLIVMGWDYASLGLRKEDDGFRVVFSTCKDAEQGGKPVVTELAKIEPSRVYAAGLLPNMELDLWLRLNVGKGGVCSFSYSLDGKKFVEVSQRFTARAGKWIGAKAGFFSVTPNGVHDRGWIDIVDTITTVK